MIVDVYIYNMIYMMYNILSHITIAIVISML